MSLDIGLVTCARFPHLDEDSALLLPALHRRGWSAEPVVWDDPTVDWSHYGVCIIRSTWDYETRRPAYLDWAEAVTSQTRLWNPVSVLRWNTDKRYLLELSHRGLPIVPSVWVDAGVAVPFSWLAGVWQTDTLVVKPTVSAGARHTFVLRHSGEAHVPDRPVLVQPYLQSVETVGELSVICFGSEVSHAVRKRPQAGDFRVQEEHGGTYVQVTPTSEELAFVQQVLRAIARPLLYARIDLMFGDGGEILLSEAEVTEPSLYHHIALDSVDTLADHIGRLLQQ